jgi:predicted N-formylglutamate amidohydrolase
MRDGFRVVVTCEHATNRVPAAYRRLFKSKAAKTALESHRGWDPGSIEIGRNLSRAVGAPLFAASASRLLIEVNRSRHHSHLFSEFSKDLDRSARAQVIATYYDAHRLRVTNAIRSLLKKRNLVLHLSVHTFTPALDGVVRNADVGLLYDPRRSRELTFCNAWKKTLKACAPRLRVRRNYPYLGRADGFTTFLRRELDAPGYLGIELEVNQRFTVPARRDDWRLLLTVLRDSLRSAIDRR